MSEGDDDARQARSNQSSPVEDEGSDMEQVSGDMPIEQAQPSRNTREYACGKKRQSIPVDRFDNHLSEFYDKRNVQRESHPEDKKRTRFEDHRDVRVKPWELLKNRRASGKRQLPRDDDADEDADDADSAPGDDNTASEEDDDTFAEDTGGKAGKAAGKGKKAAGSRKKGTGSRKKRTGSGPEDPSKPRKAVADQSSESSGDENAADDEGGRHQLTPQEKLFAALATLKDGDAVLEMGFKKDDIVTYFRSVRDIDPLKRPPKNFLTWLELVERVEKQERERIEYNDVLHVQGIYTQPHEDILDMISRKGVIPGETSIYPGGKLNPNSFKKVFLSVAQYIANEDSFPEGARKVFYAVVDTLGDPDKFTALANERTPPYTLDDIKKSGQLAQLFQNPETLVRKLTDQYTHEIPLTEEGRNNRGSLAKMLLATGKITVEQLEGLKLNEMTECLREVAGNCFYKPGVISPSNRELLGHFLREKVLTEERMRIVLESPGRAKAMYNDLVTTKDKLSVETKHRAKFADFYGLLPFLEDMVDLLDKHAGNIAAAPPAVPGDARPAPEGDGGSRAQEGERQMDESDVNKRSSRLNELLVKHKSWHAVRFIKSAISVLEQKYEAEGQDKLKAVVSNYGHLFEHAILTGKQVTIHDDDDVRDFGGNIQQASKEFSKFIWEHVDKEFKKIPAHEKQPGEMLECLILEGWEHACQYKDDEGYSKGNSIPEVEGFSLDTDRVYALVGDSADKRWLKHFFSYIATSLVVRDNVAETRLMPNTAFFAAKDSLKNFLLANDHARDEVKTLNVDQIITDALVWIADRVRRCDFKRLAVALHGRVHTADHDFFHIRRDGLVIVIDDDDDEPQSKTGAAIAAPAQIPTKDSVPKAVQDKSISKPATGQISNKPKGPVSKDGQEKARPTAATGQIPTEDPGPKVVQNKVKPRGLRVDEQKVAKNCIAFEVKERLELEGVQMSANENWDVILESKLTSPVSMLKIRLPSTESIGQGRYKHLDDWITLVPMPKYEPRFYKIFAESSVVHDPREQFKCFCMIIAFQAQSALNKGWCASDWDEKVRKLFPKKKKST